MNNKDLIHVKLEYGESIQSKKDFLSSEMYLLKILKIIKRYRFLRMEELRMKLRLLKKIKETKGNIQKLQTILPKLQIPKALKEQKTRGNIKEIDMERNEDIEQQLREIQEKLRLLEG